MSLTLWNTLGTKKYTPFQNKLIPKTILSQTIKLINNFLEKNNNIYDTK